MKRFLLENYVSDGLKLSAYALITDIRQEPVHGHDCIEMMYIVRGSGRCTVNERTYPIIRGDLFLINPGESHSYQIDDNLRCCNIMFQRDIFPDEVWEALAKFPAYRRCIEPPREAGHKFSFSEASVEKVEALLNELCAEFKNRHQGYALNAKALFLNFLVLFLREQSPGAIGSAPGYEQTFSRIFDYIAEHYGEKLTLPMLAARARINRKLFGKLFSRVSGMSFSAYLIRYRVEQSRIQLEHSDKSITEIALDCGFFDGSHFTRIFRTVLGLSPKEYRNLCRKCSEF